MIGGLAAFAVATAVVLALELVRFFSTVAADPTFDHHDVLLCGAAAGAFVLVVAAVRALRSADERAIASELDERLGLPDLVTTALALARGRVESPLGAFVAAQAGAALEGDRARAALVSIRDARVERVARIAARLALLAWLAVVALLVLDWLRSFHWPFAFLGRGPADVGILPQPTSSSDRPIPATAAGPTGDETGRSDGETRPAPAAEDAANPTPPADERDEPDVRVKARPARESFAEGEAVLVVVSATPTRELPADRDLRLSLDVDGHEAPARGDLRVGPSAPLGAGTIQDLSRIPGLAGRLSPGEHTVRARLTDARTGETFESEPTKFRVESDGDDDGGGGGGSNEPKPDPQQPQPPPPDAEPQGAPPTEPPPQADNPPPRPEPPSEPDAPRALPPEPKVAVKLDPQVVVPLFGPGDEIAKQGPRVVLVPGGGPQDAPVREADLSDALPEAARRAEADVDRAGVRAADRALVRRYFDELRRLLR